MFFIGQKELEMQYKMNKLVAQCRQKCEVMQEKFTEKLEQVHAAYQKLAKRCQILEQEMESLTKDKEELQEKFSEKARSTSSSYSFFYLTCDGKVLSCNTIVYVAQAEKKTG